MSGGLGSRTTKPEDPLHAYWRVCEELRRCGLSRQDLEARCVRAEEALREVLQQVKELQQQVEAAEAEAERIRRGGDVDRIHDLVHAIREADESASMVHDVIYAEPFDRAKASDGIWAIHAALRAVGVPPK